MGDQKPVRHTSLIPFADVARVIALRAIRYVAFDRVDKAVSVSICAETRRFVSPCPKAYHVIIERVVISASSRFFGHDCVTDHR